MPRKIKQVWRRHKLRSRVVEQRPGGSDTYGRYDVLLFLLGYGTSMIGTAMVPVALGFALLAEGRSAQDVGYVFAAQSIPMVGLLLLGGVVADRSRRATMIGADLLRCITEAGLALAFLSGRPSLSLVMSLAAGLGIGQAFFNPALSGLMPQLTPTTNLYRANALKAVVSSTGQLLGPAIAGIIIVAFGAGWALAVDAATYALSALSLLLLQSEITSVSRRESTFSELRAGWKEFTSRSWLWTIVAQFGLFRMMVYGPFLVLGAVLAKNSSGGASSWGFILSAQGAGSLVGGLSIQRIHPRHPLVVATLGTFTFAAPVAALALHAPEGVVIGASALAGIGIAVFGTLWESTLQLEVPPAALSRVAAYDWLGSYALIPVGYVLAGLIAKHLGIRETLGLSTIWAVLSSAVVIAVPGVRRLARSGNS